MASSVWALAGVEAEAFSRRERPCALGRLSMRLLMALALLGYERREHASGQAVCLLRARRARSALGLACLVAGLVLVTGASPVAGLALVVFVGVPMAPLALRAVRSPRRLQVPRSSSGNGTEVVYVHSLASVSPGAGAELLVQLADEADKRGWVLVLDADNPKLTKYYTKFGFQVEGSAPTGGPLSMRLKRKRRVKTRLMRTPSSRSCGGWDDGR